MSTDLIESTAEFPSRSVRWRECLLVLLAVGATLGLGFSHLDGPSLWHDELVHVFVAKNIAAYGWPTLPSGIFYPSSMAYNALLAGVVGLFGDGAAAVRAPSVLLAGLNVLLVYILARRLVGRPAALVAALALAFSPWHVAWARQARMYQLQTTAYLLMLGWSWQALESSSLRRSLRYTAMASAAYALGMLSSFHSILFLAPVGVYAVFRLAAKGQLRSRWAAAFVLCAVFGVITLIMLLHNPNQTDQAAVFQTGLGGHMPDPQRQTRFFYFDFLRQNLSVGFFLLAMLGTPLLVWKRGWKGYFLVLAFWVPVLTLTFLIGYRRFRFMFFAFPCYMILFAFAVEELGRIVARFFRIWRDPAVSAPYRAAYAVLSLVILAYALRLSDSFRKLTLDSLTVAGGANTTLARAHPQWRKPGEYVRRRRIDEAVLTTTYLPALYYAGHVDNWFPNRYCRWESQESGLEGLGSLAELQTFIKEHPKGYFIAEQERFEKWRHHKYLPELGEEVAWVEQNMKRVDEACSEDVTVYTWGT